MFIHFLFNRFDTVVLETFVCSLAILFDLLPYLYYN